MHTIKPSKNYFLDAVQTGKLLPLSAELDLTGLTPLSALEAIRGEAIPFFSKVPG